MKRFLKLTFIAAFVVSIALFVVGCQCATKSKIDFYANGKVVHSIETYGKCEITPPEDPILEGKVFEGWYLDADYKTPFTMNYVMTTEIKGTVKVYANFVDSLDISGTEIKTSTLEIEGDVLSTSVSNLVAKYSFKWEIKTSLEATYKIATDSECTNLVETPNQTVLLSEGNNIFYVKVELLDGSDSKIYQVNVYRKRMYTVTFDTNGGSAYGPVQVEEGQLCEEPSGVIKNGYEISSWDFDFSTPITGDITITASWSIITYQITYHNVEEATHTNRTEYTIETDTFTLSDAVPNNSEWEFSGWYLDESCETKVIQIERGTYGNLNIYATFGGQYKISFANLNGYSFADISVPSGYEIAKPTIPSECEISGYEVNFYTDAEYTNKYEFSVMPLENLTLYPCYDYTAVNTGFFEYLEEFNSNNISIDDEAEFIAYIDYLGYNNIVQTNAKTISVYTTNVSDTISRIMQKNSYGLTSGISTTTIGDKYKLYLTKDSRSTECQKTTTLTNDYTQLGNVAYLGDANERASGYTDFEINKLTREVEGVETSNQLVYVLEHGYKPICVANSSAEEMYNLARSVLIDTVGDSMTDYQKIKAIYDYLVYNVAYDYDVLEVSDWTEYDAYFLEGVFNNGKAVCDGISKAFTVLSKIEGIPAVRVAGKGSTNSTNADHAWNKVMVENKWYVCDATWGTGKINLSTPYENFAYKHFMTSDTEKQALGATATSYLEIECNGTYNYYQSNTFTYGGTTYNYVIESDSELAILFDYYATYYANNASKNYPYIVVDFVAGYTMSSINSCISTAKSNMSGSTSFSLSMSASSAEIGDIVVLYIKRA